jgi:hypothetical protein
MPPIEFVDTPAAFDWERLPHPSQRVMRSTASRISPAERA